MGEVGGGWGGVGGVVVLCWGVVLDLCFVAPLVGAWIEIPVSPVIIAWRTVSLLL